jgi:hypothetical protein
MAGDAIPAPDCGAFSHPAASSLSDDFRSASPSADWITPSGCAQQVDGGVVLKVQGVSNYCFLATANRFHLTCDSLFVKVPFTTRPTLGVQTLIELDAANGDKAYLILEDNSFVFGMASGGPTNSPIGPYDSAQDIWWRLREVTGNLHFDTSADGVTWVERGSVRDPIPLDNVGIQLGVGEYKSVPDGGEAQFRCYNHPPPCQ